jgi:hypothetical protein
MVIELTRTDIGAEAAPQVVKVTREHVERSVLVEVGVRAHVIHREVYPDDAVRVTDSVELLVSEVPC